MNASTIAEESTRWDRLGARALGWWMIIGLQFTIWRLRVHNWWLRRRIRIRRRPVRQHIATMQSGLNIYRVQLVNGPCDGAESVASGDTVYLRGERYLRGPDDRYYHAPEGSGWN